MTIQPGKKDVALRDCLHAQPRHSTSVSQLDDYVSQDPQEALATLSRVEANASDSLQRNTASDERQWTLQRQWNAMVDEWKILKAGRQKTTVFLACTGLLTLLSHLLLPAGQWLSSQTAFTWPAILCSAQIFIDAWTIAPNYRSRKWLTRLTQRQTGVRAKGEIHSARLFFACADETTPREKERDRGGGVCFHVIWRQCSFQKGKLHLREKNAPTIKCKGRSLETRVYLHTGLPTNHSTSPRCRRGPADLCEGAGARRTVHAAADDVTVSVPVTSQQSNAVTSVGERRAGLHNFVDWRWDFVYQLEEKIKALT